MQSGTALNEWSVDALMDKRSLKLAECLKCPTENQRKVLEFLRGIDDLDTLFSPVLATLSADERRRGLPIAFKPTVERDCVNMLKQFRNKVYVQAVNCSWILS